MLERVKALAAEQAKWEAEEKERARLEALRAARQQAGPTTAGPNRPLMIRTGKAKTGGACLASGGGEGEGWRRRAMAALGQSSSACPRRRLHPACIPPALPWPTLHPCAPHRPADGTRIVLKCMGKDPFPPARGTGAVDTVCGEEQVAQCRWGYQCSVCQLAGDLLCCEVGAARPRGLDEWVASLPAGCWPGALPMPLHSCCRPLLLCAATLLRSTPRCAACACTPSAPACPSPAAPTSA